MRRKRKIQAKERKTVKTGKHGDTLRLRRPLSSSAKSAVYAVNDTERLRRTSGGIRFGRLRGGRPRLHGMPFVRKLRTDGRQETRTVWQRVYTRLRRVPSDLQGRLPPLQIPGSIRFGMFRGGRPRLHQTVSVIHITDSVTSHWASVPSVVQLNSPLVAAEPRWAFRGPDPAPAANRSAAFFKARISPGRIPVP